MIFVTCLLIVSCLIWAANLVLIFLAYWLPGVSGFVPALAVGIMVEFFIMLYLCNKNGMENTIFHDETPRIFTFLGIASFACTLLSGIVFLILFHDGGPEIADGVYCIWNHGFVREISEAEYRFLSQVESLLIPCYTLAFSAAPMTVFSAIRERKILQEYMDANVREAVAVEESLKG